MPTYVYQCSSCSNTFEAEQRITENPLTTCHCGSEGTVKRIIQPIAVMFKGSGFHINDYKSNSSGGGTTASAASTPAPAAESCTGNPASCACSTEPSTN